MKVFEFLNMLGNQMVLQYEIHWFSINGDDIYFITEFEEVVIEIFGDWDIVESDSIYFKTKDHDPIIQIYIERKGK